MTTKDKENKSLHEKLRTYFKRTGAGGENLNNRPQFIITSEMERELSVATPHTRRMKAIKDLSDVVLTSKLEEMFLMAYKQGMVHHHLQKLIPHKPLKQFRNFTPVMHLFKKALLKLWVLTKDLLDPESPKETRQNAFSFIRLLVVGQYEQLDSLRALLFNFVKDHNFQEDYLIRFDLLYSLTENGRDIKCFDYEIGPFILDWMPQVQFPEHLQELLSMIVNLVKFNASYLDEYVVSGLVCNCCYLCCYSSVPEVVLSSLQVLEAIVCYSIFPQESLHTLVASLCRTVNVEQYCRTSWKIMRNVLGTDLGHAALLMMCEVLKDLTSDTGLARGAVFYINMALWGSKRVPTLKATHASVLPCFLHALGNNQSVVTFEVILALQSLINKHGQELHESAWDVFFTTMQIIIGQMDAMPTPNQLMLAHLHETITTVEQILEQRKFNGSVVLLYSLIDQCSSLRPEQSVIKLINYKASSIDPTYPEWLTTLAQLCDKFIRLETRTAIRTHALHTLHAILEVYRSCYEEELLDRVLISLMNDVALDTDIGIRTACAKILLDMAFHTQSKGCTELLDSLEKQLNRPFEVNGTTDECEPTAEADFVDIRLIVNGLLNIFHSKLFKHPASFAVKIYQILLKHLELHYANPELLQQHVDIRIKIIELFLSARANKYGQIGFKYDSKGNPLPGASKGKACFSPYVLIEAETASSADSVKGTQSPVSFQHQMNVSYVSIRRACKMIVTILKQERDWKVLRTVLKEIPFVMQNKALILSKNNNDIDLLAAALCSLVVSDKSWSARANVSEITSAALSALACVAPYHAHLDSHTQQKIVWCLFKYGLVLRSPQQIISALTIFTLETRETMAKMLPEVLLELSKISDTCLIAGPILEFLSTLTRLPKVFASFVADQYMSVFAILLPYTNPSRYNHYIVYLAHHVIAAWFLKCRLNYRRDFVTFIIHSLHNYMIVPLEEAKFKWSDVPHHSVNEDSSNRIRSSSLGSKGREPPIRANLSPDSKKISSAAFHLELTETCIDLMARYAFSPCSLKPRRSPTAELVFSGGPSQTWLIGHKLITITTSGCTQNSLKSGLCDRCATICKQHWDPEPSPAVAANSIEPNEEIVSLDDKSLVEVKRQNSSEVQADEGCASMSPKIVMDSGEDENQSTIQTEKPIKPDVSSIEDDVQINPWSKVWGTPNSSVSGGPGANGSGAVSCKELLGQCTCWCSGWAEVYIRRPTGDVAWVMRMQNQMNFESFMEPPFSDIEGILAHQIFPSSAAVNTSATGIDSCNDTHVAEYEARSRSPSSLSNRVLESNNSYKFLSDTMFQSPPHIFIYNDDISSSKTTEPMPIPVSPQRQSSSSNNTTDDDLELALKVDFTRARNPVRRSNSSPEMSSSWKSHFYQKDTIQHDEVKIVPDSIEPEDCSVKNEETNNDNGPSAQQLAHSTQKKVVKKAELRVSCEAIPEEILCNTPTHPQLLTRNSDPGSSHCDSGQQNHMGNSSTDSVAEKDDDKACSIGANSSDSDVKSQSNECNTDKLACFGAAVEDSNKSKPPTSPVKIKNSPKLMDDLPPIARSRRANTISGMSPIKKRRDALNRENREGPVRGVGGVTPTFVLLQLYHHSDISLNTNGLSERPLPAVGSIHERTIKNLDLVPTSETYKIGVLYVGPGQQENEIAILKNEFGNLRYAEFVHDLGTLIELEDADKHGLFLNVEKGGRDGHFTYVWQDDIMQVQFHVATLMPNNENDVTCVEKRMHIGNDYVSIVYNNSGADFNIHTLKGQFNFCIVVIEPLEHGINRVSIRTKDEHIQTKYLGQAEPKIISDQNVALLARQMALHCTLASLISRSLNTSESSPYAPNSLERLRIIKRLRARLLSDKSGGDRQPVYSSAHNDFKRLIDDFTKYT